MANNNTLGTPVGANRFALIIWYGNEPELIIYAVETLWDFDEAGNPVNRGWYRNCKTSEPVDAQSYHRYNANVLDALPMYQSGVDISKDFLMETF
jgi:hypothetical protein